MKKNNKVIRGILLFAVVIGAVFLMAVLTGGMDHAKPDEIVYGQFIQLVREERVSQAVVVETQLVGLYSDDSANAAKFPTTYDFITNIPSSEVLFADLKAEAAAKTGKPLDEITSADVDKLLNLDTQPRPEQSWVLSILPYVLTLAVLAGLWFLFMRQMNGANNKAMSFGKTRARLAEEKTKKVSFNDVAGADEEKEELAEIVEFLKNPKKFNELGARIPKGVLLVGPPGTGKTLLAKAVAGEAGVPFYSISGSDFVEMYVGVGASRVRDMFEQAKRNAPCIVFIDEIDAVGRHRGAGLGGGHDEREQTLNQLLVEMDGFDANEGIIILAATNRPDILDPALLRPGRFDRRVTVNYPDVNGREAILRVHSRKKPLDEDVKLDVIARRTPFFTGADLENVMNEAALLAARKGQKKITMWNVTEAINRVELGPEKRSHKTTREDKELVAYHESGHAVVAWSLKECDPVHEVSIIPRGGAGGYTQTLPQQESDFITRAKLKASLAMAMGGYIAEKLVFGDITAGSSSDIKHASNLARRMVTEWGMSAKVGPLFLGGDQEVFIGLNHGTTHNYSEGLAALVDEEVQGLINEALATATHAIETNLENMKRLAAALLEREKVNGDEFKQIMNGEALPAAGEDTPSAESEPAQVQEETEAVPVGETTEN